LGAIGLAVVLMVLLHFLEPGFDPSWRMLSEYSLGRFGVLMRIAFLAMGTGVIAAAVGLPGSVWLVKAPLVLVSAGPLGAAFVDTDPITTPRAELSARSKAHAVLGALFILGFPLAASVAGIGAAGEVSVGPALAWASVIPWLGLAWFLGATLRYGGGGDRGAPEVRIGWPNRGSMLAYLGWAATAAVLILS
jgi:hypothetical protein